MGHLCKNIPNVKQLCTIGITYVGCAADKKLFTLFAYVYRREMSFPCKLEKFIYVYVEWVWVSKWTQLSKHVCTAVEPLFFSVACI